MAYNKVELLGLPLFERKEIANVLIASILAEETKHKPEWKQELMRETLKYNITHPGSDSDKEN